MNDFEQLLCTVRAGKGAEIHVQSLIVTLPDPVDSHLQSYFDADFAVIQRAIQRHRFVLQDYSLPWQEWLRQETNSQLPSHSGPRSYEQEPGILLYRREKQCDNKQDGATRFGDKNSDEVPQVDFLVVLIVGETPSAGVHVDAYRKALDISLAWSTLSNRSDVRVIGPSFSGSCFSLRQTTAAWFRDRNDVSTFAGNDELLLEFVSGSATSESDLCKLDFRQQSGAASLRSRIATTLHPDSVLLAALWRFLRIESHQVALLVEADTPYGQEAGAAALGDFSKALLLPYPMEIGRLRSEYDKVSILKYGPEAVAENSRTNLEVPLEQSRHARDLLPIFSDTTAAVTERRLVMMLRSIADRDIRAVGLIGTDPKDLLFLAQQVRRYCPDVLLFTLESHVLYTHPDYARHFEGTLVASTYPLFLARQEWSHSAGNRYNNQFSGSTVVGVFNAALAQMERVYPADDKLCKTSTVRLIEYDRPDDPNSYGSPPVWLTIVGRGAMSPLAIENPSLLGNLTNGCPRTVSLYKPVRVTSAHHPTHPSGILDLPPLFGITICSTVLTTLLSAIFLMHAAPHPTKQTIDHQITVDHHAEYCTWLSLDRVVVVASKQGLTFSSVPDPWRCMYAATLFAGVATIQAMLAVVVVGSGLAIPHIYSRSWTVIIVRILAVFALALCLVAFGRSVTAGFAAVPIRRAPYLIARNGGVVVTGMSMVAATVFAYVVWTTIGPAHLNWSITLERWGSLINGLSPIAPIGFLLLVPILWAICHLRRKMFVDIYGILNPFPDDVKQTAGLSRRLSDLNNKLSRALWWPTEVRDWVFVGILVLAMLAIAYRWIPTLEGPKFDWIVWLLFPAAIAFVAGLHLRFMAAAGLLERFLRRVAQTPLSAAFANVPPRLKDKVAGQIFAANPHPGDNEIAIRQLAEVARLQESEIEVLASRASEHFYLLDSLGRTSRRLVHQGSYTVRQVLSEACSKLATLFLTTAYGRCQDEAKVYCQEQWREAASNYVAIEITAITRQSFAHIQNVLTFLTAAVLALVIAVHSYPFQPHRFLSMCIVGLVLWLVVTTTIVLLKFNRNEILSRLSGTTPNRFSIDRSLVFQVLTYSLLPLLSLLAFQYPEVGNSIFGWMQGMSGILK